MERQKATLAQICGFLKQRRLAMVGVSRDSKDFTRGLFREFVRRGYDVVPVHPGVAEIEGRPCYAHVADITPPVDSALLLTPPAVTNEVVRDCAAAGVTQVWMHRATGQGAVSQDAVAYCKTKGMDVVAGECPLMFLPDTGCIHRFHGFVRKLTGCYPQ